MCIINEEIISMLDGNDRDEKYGEAGLNGDAWQPSDESDEEIIAHLNQRISL